MTNKIKSIHLELISKCNLKCVHCEINRTEYESKNSKLDYDSIINLLEELKPDEKNSISLILQGVGEASLHPRFNDILIKGVSLGYRVSTTSNLLAWNKEKYETFLANGLNLMTVSIDTLNQELTAITRKGTNVTKLKDNFSHLAKTYTNKLHVYTVVSDLTIDYIEDIYHFLKENKIRKWQFIYLLNIDGSQGITAENKIVLKNKVKEYSQIEVILPTEQNNSYCVQPSTILHVNAMGYIMPCCLHWDHNLLEFGRITNKNIQKQFDSKKFSTFRKEMIHGKADLCKSCTLYKKYPEKDY